MNPEKTVRANSKYSDRDYQALHDVLAYAKDEEKTEREYFCEGINCNVETARDQFITVKKPLERRTEYRLTTVISVSKNRTLRRIRRRKSGWNLQGVYGANGIRLL